MIHLARQFLNNRLRLGIPAMFAGAMIVATQLATHHVIRAADAPVAEKPASPFVITDAARAHWAFRPIRRDAPPNVSSQKNTVINPIDDFILAKLQARGLSFSAPADKATLIRRVTFDLIGLPPTPAEVDSFVTDQSPDAYEKLIDRLLASPHYGERWGRHWLDLARFAETDGYEYDAIRPNIWRYRDYVIRAFNDDKPYDRFIREQIAGDELWPQEPDARIATGFNLLGPDMVDSSDQIQRHHNTLNDMTDTTALTFLGLTVGCARCHDHKFDPISQHDYYSLQAFFSPAAFVKEQPVATPADHAAYEAAMKRFNETPAVRELTELEAPVREMLRDRKLAKLAPEAQSAHRTPPEKRTAEQANLVLETDEMLRVSDKDVASNIPADQRQRYADLLEAIKKLPHRPTLPLAMALADPKGARVETFILHRGEYSQPREKVEPGFPGVLVKAGATPPAGQRAELADWLVSPQNPLTARVMVNRIWQHHFGRGLVETPSDFGTRGLPPTHPELLDWLAGEFINPSTGLTPWSIKRMHKLMLLSATYRQATFAADQDSRAREIDPENHLYWHMNRQRLEGEVLRDSLLAISGQLNEEMGGPGVYPPIPTDVFKGSTGWKTAVDAREASRRSVYIFARRNLRFPFLEVFDAPDSNLSCPIRERSTTAPQALMLLNSDDVLSTSKATATRVMKDAKSEKERIVLAYQLTLGRAPTPREVTQCHDFLARSPLNELCRALFNLNEFVYVE